MIVFVHWTRCNSTLMVDPFLCKFQGTNAGCSESCNTQVFRLTQYYLEIKVKSSSFPISYHGEFHYRSGSTKQQLTGVALSEFIMNKTGFRWEDVTVDNVTVDDLDDESFRIFREEAMRKKRMSEAELNVTNTELLQRLHLMKDGKLKKSAILLFHKDPSMIQNGSYVKIGKFDEQGRVIYHDDLEGSLIANANEIIDLIYRMYLKAKITYEHDRRVETYPYARGAIREAVYNALAHNCYMYGVPIQIRIMEDSIMISNSCILPEGWTVDTLMEVHESKPYNPDIANVFYRAGFIENWGQGIQKICDECTALGAELPRYEMIGNGIRVYFKGLESALIIDSKAPKRHKNGALDGALEQRIIDELRLDPGLSQKDIAERLGSTRRTVQRKMEEMVQNDVIKRVGGKRFGQWEIREKSN